MTGVVCESPRGLALEDGLRTTLDHPVGFHGKMGLMIRDGRLFKYRFLDEP